MKFHEHIEADGFESQPERYKRIDGANKKSFLMTEGSPLRVLQSLHSIGDSREDPSAERFVIDGNMSPLGNYGPSDLTKEEKVADAKNNLTEFFYSADIDPADVRILHPERDYSTPLTMLNLDEAELSPDGTGLLRLDEAGDMMYTHDTTVTMAARPADCPIAFVTANTPKGEVSVLLHLATLGVAHGYVPQAKEKLDELNVDWESVRVQLTPGGHAETYNYTNFKDYDPREEFPDSKNLYVNVKEKRNEAGETVYDYDVDVAAQTYQDILEYWDVDAYQVFADTTDTTSPTSGYSSNSRAFKGYEVDGDNTRDIVLAGREKYPVQNPDKPAPAEVLADIKQVRVKYLDFDGEQHIGTVEIHKDLADDVKQFFELAVELGFPIQRVVKSSDKKYEWDDDKLMADNATTGYNYRLIKGTDRPSLHGLGRALDVNDLLNPYVRYVDGKALTDPEGAAHDPSVAGTLTAEHPLVLFLKERGWVWGGDWTEKGNGVTDYQHFQKAS